MTHRPQKGYAVRRPLVQSEKIKQDVRKHHTKGQNPPSKTSSSRNDPIAETEYHPNSDTKNNTVGSEVMIPVWRPLDESKEKINIRQVGQKNNPRPAEKSQVASLIKKWKRNSRSCQTMSNGSRNRMPPIKLRRPASFKKRQHVCLRCRFDQHIHAFTVEEIETR